MNLKSYIGGFEEKQGKGELCNFIIINTEKKNFKKQC